PSALPLEVQGREDQAPTVPDRPAPSGGSERQRAWGLQVSSRPMDSLIAAAARALAEGDMITALQRVALRDDPPALALRGIAMAPLGEHPRAGVRLRRAARAFGTHEGLARARCIVAEAEVALAMRDLGGSPRALATAAATLEAHADRANALLARLI